MGHVLTALAGVMTVGNADTPQEKVSHKLWFCEMSAHVKPTQTTAFRACYVVTLKQLMAAAIGEADPETASSYKEVCRN